MGAGRYDEVTFANGTTPAINEDNLNEITRVCKETDEELAKSKTLKFSELKEYFYERNTNQFIFFDDYTAWSVNFPTTTTISDETDNNIMDDGAIKITSTTNAVAFLEIVRSGLSFDFTKFYDGSASDTSDVLNCVYYVSDHTLIQGLWLDFGNDSSNHFRLLVWAHGGWNCDFPRKSDFATVGSPNWNNITWIRVSPYCVANSSGEYCYVQHISLCRKDPVYSGYGNPFQKYKGITTGWENLFSVYWDTCLLYKDRKASIDRIGWMKVDAEDEEEELNIIDSVINFILRVEIYCKYEDNSPSITWYYSSSNFIEVYIDSGTLYLDVTEGGVLTSSSIALETTLSKDERFYLYVEKNYQTIRVILKKDGELIKILEYETSISADVEGDLSFGQYDADYYGLITDFEYSNKPIYQLPEENLPRYVRQKTDQSFSNNTPANVTGMFAKLKTHKTYKVSAVIVATSTSATPDVKIAWDLTDCEMIDGNRHSVGPATATTSVTNTNVNMSSVLSTTNNAFGLGGSTIESYINEIFFIKTSHGNPTIQLQGAQSVTDGSNPTSIKAMSHMIIEEVVPQE